MGEVVRRERNREGKGGERGGRGEIEGGTK